MSFNFGFELGVLLYCKVDGMEWGCELFWLICNCDGSCSLCCLLMMDDLKFLCDVIYMLGVDGCLWDVFIWFQVDDCFIGVGSFIFDGE